MWCNLVWIIHTSTIIFWQGFIQNVNAAEMNSTAMAVSRLAGKVVFVDKPYTSTATTVWRGG